MTVHGLLLTHGAGGHRDHRLFVALEDRLDIAVERPDFAYRSKGPRQPPPRVETLVAEVVTLAEAFGQRLGVPTSTIVIGGRSLGGRACSMAVADGLDVAGLVLLSYPLHPPGKPDRLRTDHLGAITVPVLALSGDRDPFGTPSELRTHLAAVRGPLELVELAGDAHDPKKHDDLVLDRIERWIAER